MNLIERIVSDVIMEGLHVLPRRRDPAVVAQTTEAATKVLTAGRLLREIQGLQGELERSRPTKRQGDATTWGSNSSSSR